MTTYAEAAQIRDIVSAAQRVVIIQADNPDGDSLASALTLEQILGDMGKEPHLYCGVDIPSYLRYLPGWDRVTDELPSQFDASIIVDTSSDSLLEKLLTSGQKHFVASKPCVVLDHHGASTNISFATVTCNQPVVATGELVYELAGQLGWPLNLAAKQMIATSIMADSLGLVTEATTARSIHIIAELVEGGVSLAELEFERRMLMRKSPELVAYKGQLLQRIDYFADNRIATVTIPWKEIEKYSPQYNPSMLVLEEMRMTVNVELAIAFKLYDDGKVTAKIRANQGSAVAAELATHFGGGGHPYASGFKIQDGRPFNEVKSECIAFATQLLDDIKRK
jgi:phosphoesterase RecJ-like protein